MFVNEKSNSERDSFLAEKAKNRENRETNRIRTESAVKIQSLIRGFLARRKWRHERKNQIEIFTKDNSNWVNLENSAIHLALRGILFKYDEAFDDILEQVCRLLSVNCLSANGNPQSWFTALCLSPKFASLHIIQVRRLIGACCSSISRSWSFPNLKFQYIFFQ